MGCDCSKPREKEPEPAPKETLSRCVMRSMTTKPTYSRSPRHETIAADMFATDLIKTQPLDVSYRVETVLRDDDKTALLHVQHIGTQQQCFIKRLKKASGRALLHQKAKLSAEADRLSKLDHPQILRTLEVLQDDNYVYTAVEAFPGGQLQDYLSDPRIRKENVAAKVMQQLFRALCYCHHTGVIHGQLTLGALVMPDTNVDDNIKIKVTGFGELDSLPSKQTSNFRAPEVLQGFNEKCDIWSCGIILSLLLKDEAPFRTSKRLSHRRTSTVFSPSTWQDTSEEVVSFIAQMLNFNPHMRPTAAECLKHPWIQKYTRTPFVRIGLFNTCLFNLRKLKNRSPLQEAVLKFIVTRVIREKEMESYLSTFYAVDVDGDGALEEEELKKQFGRVMGEAEAAQATTHAIEAMSYSGGAITFSEFLVACLGEHKLMSESHLHTVFSCLDQGTGRVAVEDLKTAFFIKRTADRQRQWREFLIQADKASEDSVTFTEFSALLNVSVA